MRISDWSSDVCSSDLAFAQKLVAAVQAMPVGDGLQDGTRIGPLIDAKAVAKVQEHIADAVAKGARVLAGGKPHALGQSFFEPTVLAGVTQDMAVAREERSEEHTSELQSLMRLSYAVFCLDKKNHKV